MNQKKTLKKWLIGALATAILAGAAAIALSKPKREIYVEKAQEHLDISLERVKPQYLERIIFDPDFKEQDRFLRNQLKSHSKESEIEKYVLEARKNQSSHNMCVTRHKM